ncbi:MAG: C40 family peptidase [Sulfuriferula sp.]
MSLIGSVYKFGGDNPDTGMDCSGFVRYVYHEVAGIKLPHSAMAISKISTIIHKTELKPGDLVFFKTMRKAFSHVGIYLGNNRFIHAASSKSGVVMISRLDDAYWAGKYDGARRLLSSQKIPSATGSDSIQSDPTPSDSASLLPGNSSDMAATVSTPAIK